MKMEKRMERARERGVPGAAKARKELNRAKAAKEKESAEARKRAREYMETEGSSASWVSKLQQAGGMFAEAERSPSVDGDIGPLGESSRGGLSLPLMRGEPPAACSHDQTSSVSLSGQHARRAPPTEGPTLVNAADGMKLLKRARADAAAKEMKQWLANEEHTAEEGRVADEKRQRKRKRAKNKAKQQRMMLSFSPDEEDELLEET